MQIRLHQIILPVIVAAIVGCGDGESMHNNTLTPDDAKLAGKPAPPRKTKKKPDKEKVTAKAGGVISTDRPPSRN